MSESTVGREDIVIGYTAFALFILGGVLPFVTFSHGHYGAYDEINFPLFLACQVLAFMNGIVARRTRIGRIAARSAFLLGSIVASLVMLSVWC